MPGTVVFMGATFKWKSDSLHLLKAVCQRTELGPSQVLAWNLIGPALTLRSFESQVYCFLVLFLVQKNRLVPMYA